MALPRRTKLITRFCLRRLSFLTYYAVMKRDEVLRKLKEAEANLRAQGVAHAALFGSVAR